MRRSHLVCNPATCISGCLQVWIKQDAALQMTGESLSQDKFVKRYDENDLTFEICNVKVASRPVLGSDGVFNYVVGRAAVYDYLQPLTQSATQALEQLRSLCAGTGCSLVGDVRNLHVSPHYGLGVRYSDELSCYANKIFSFVTGLARSTSPEPLEGDEWILDPVI